MADLSIQKAFLEGIQEVYNTMFSDKIYFSYLDEETTYKNVYRESMNKRYKEPIKLSGKISFSSEQSKNNTVATEAKSALVGNQLSSIFTIPTKELIDNGIPTTMESLDKLAKGMIKFDSVTYQIDNVVPKTYIAGTYLFYVFECTQVPKSSISELM